MTTHHHHFTRMTIDFPADKHKELKALAALMGIPMKDFILSCVLEKLDKRLSKQKSHEDEDIEAFDKGIKNIKQKGGITLEEMKRRLGLNKKK